MSIYSYNMITMTSCFQCLQIEDEWTLDDCTQKTCEECADPAECTSATKVTVTQEGCPDGEQCIQIGEHPTCVDGEYIFINCMPCKNNVK